MDKQMTYPEFVDSRAKRMGSLAADLHHAATGIVTEVVEWLQAAGRENQQEEIGDITFYLCHFHQAWTWHGEAMPEYHGEAKVTAPRDIASLNTLLVVEAGELLGLTKKLWVYNKPVTAEMRQEMALRWQRIHAAVLMACNAMDYFTAASDNQRKLEQRYPTGYSDAAAQQRADKPAGE